MVEKFFPRCAEQPLGTAALCSLREDRIRSGLPKGAAHGIGGHIMALGHEPHHYTLFYVEVEDIANFCEKAPSPGGKVCVPPVAIGGGKFDWIQDNGAIRRGSGSRPRSTFG